MNAPAQSQLKRTLGLTGLTLFGVTYMTVITVFTTYGSVNSISKGHLPASYVIAIIAMLFTAASYGAMVKKYPVAGSAYTYTQQSFGGTAGFLTGWVMLLDYLFIPMINFLVIGLYMNRLFPEIPNWVFTLSALALVLLFNVLGITLVSKVNATIIVLSLIMVGMFVVLSLKQASNAGAPVDFLAPLSFGDGGLGPIASGAGVLALSFLGFDAVTTLSEEAKRPRKDIPRAIFLSTLIGGALFILVSWAGALAYSPDWSTLSQDQLDTVGVTIAEMVGNDAFGKFFIAVYVAGAFGSGMTGQVSVSRILYAMGRDGLLPRKLATLHRRFGTPAIAAIVVSAFALLALVLSLDTVATLISFGALAAFSMVNLSVIRSYVFPRGGRTTPITAWHAIRYLILPFIGFALTLYLWTTLAPIAWIVGGSWLVAGIIIVLGITRMFSRPVPKMDFSEDGPTTEHIDLLGEAYPLDGDRRG